MMDDDDDWQEMPVVQGDQASLSSSDEGESSTSRRKGGKIAGAYSARNAYKHGRTNSGYNSMALGGGHGIGQYGDGTSTRKNNATGVSLDIDDARGYNWRARPELRGGEGSASTAATTNRKKPSADSKKRRVPQKKGDAEILTSSSSSESNSDEESDEGGARGYTQLRLDDDPEAEDLNAATDYLFTGGGAGSSSYSKALNEVDGTGATPHSQLNTTKNLLSEGQKIAYVGLVSLAAKHLIRQLERVPGAEMKNAISSATEWRLRVMARMYQHMDIDGREQKMIESLAEHGVLTSDLAPSLITTQTVDNPDFDPQALLDREEEERERAEGKERERAEEEERKREAIEQGDSHKAEAEAEEEGMGGDAKRESDEEGVNDEDEGDLGVSIAQSTRDEDDRTGLPAYADESQEQENTHLSKADFQVKESTDLDDGDLGATPSTEVRKEVASDNESTHPPSYREAGEDSDIGVTTGDAHTEEKTKVIVVDPNTATRIDTMGESLHEEQVTSMGLTNKPQTIDAMPSALDGVTTELSSADKTITLDLRWTVLCDLFLVLTADSVYDSRSRVLLERVAEELQLSWMDVTKFEKRVTDALEIEEGVSGNLKGKKAVRKRAQMARKRRMVMMGLATVGGGLVIGLSAGLMAPLIGAGLGAALGTIGIGGTTGFLTGVGGATIITSTGVAAGSALGGTGMNKRTKTVSIFEFKPIHNNKRVNCIITVPGFMSGPMDDARLPFSVVDSIMGDIFSLLWEPDMMQDMGNAIYLLWNETLVQGVQQILAVTIAGGLVGALAWPLWLTKLGYFIDNPWSNALDRAHSCGLILADVLSKRKLGVRPITLVGFSLGARVIFYALVELARTKKFGIIQNVYLIGAPITVNDKMWREARAVVAGRFVNAYSRTDWILGWLFRATTGGLSSIAGLRPVERVPEVENVDVTKTVPGHLQYRAFMPLVLDQLGFRTTAEYFDEPEDVERIPEREIVYDEPLDDRKLKSVQTKTGGFGKIFRRKGTASESGTDTPNSGSSRRPSAIEDYDDDLPPREASPLPGLKTGEAGRNLGVPSPQASSPRISAEEETEKMLAELRESGIVVRELESSLPTLVANTKSNVRQGSTLRETITADAAAQLANEDSDEEEDEGHETIDVIPPTVTVSDSDAPIGSDAGKEDLSSDDPPSSGHLAYSKPYAKRFGSTTFDSEGLPPSAPQVSHEASLDLSFSETYDYDAEDEVAEARQQGGKQLSTDFESSGNQYGLSAQAARELALQFQSAGMSSAGAMAAAQIAHNLEAAQDPTKERHPVLPMSSYDGFGFAGASRSSRSGSTSLGGEADPWGAVAPSPDDNTPQPSYTGAGRLEERSDGLTGPSLTPTANSTDNPWG